jgi:hypothetical protein
MGPQQLIDRAMQMFQQQAHLKARRYMDDLVRMNCGPDLLALKVFPNAKEVSESMGAFYAVRKHLGDKLFGDSDVHVVAVGDGCTPRTAALFAFLTRWTCWSVDPRLVSKDKYAAVNRLHVVPTAVEQFKLPACKRAIIVAVHSHADLTAAVKACAAAERVDVIAIPCCVLQELRLRKEVIDPRAPDVEYEDFGIGSPHRTVRLWIDLRRSDRGITARGCCNTLMDVPHDPGCPAVHGEDYGS